MPYTAFNSVSQMGFAANGAALKERYIPLWVYSSGATGANANSPAYAQKGFSAGVSSPNTSQAKLHTLSNQWSASQTFVLEVSLSSYRGYTVYAALYDITTNAVVSGSMVSTTSTTAILLRSGSVTLVPGHVYGVQFYCTDTNNGNAYLTKAHLVAIN